MKFDSKKTKILFIINCILISAIIFMGGFWVSRLALDDDIETITYILDMYKKHYFYEEEDVVGIFENSLLDQYSDYYTKEEYDEIQKQNSGVRFGIGMVINQDLEVIEVYGNSPAQNANIGFGDKILAIKLPNASEFIEVSNLNDFNAQYDLVANNAEFSFKYLKDGEEKITSLERKDYLRSFVKYYDDSGEWSFSNANGNMQFLKINQNKCYDVSTNLKVGVIKYDGFSGDSNGLDGSAGQFEKALEKFKENGKTKLILDLRNNGGGFISILEKVSAHLIEAEQGARVPISIIRDKHGNERIDKSARVDSNKFGFEQIIVLANVNTASASESLIGALLDYDASNKVKVVLEGYSANGTTYYRTYGKGIMQTTFSKITGEAIKLTTAQLHWPLSNICIHNVGVTKELGEKIVEESSSGSCFSDALALCN